MNIYECGTDGHIWEVVKGRMLNDDPDDFTRTWLLKCKKCGKEQWNK